MIPQTRKYFVITVHYGSLATTQALLTSIEAGSYIPDTVIVIDHAADPFVPAGTSLPTKIIRPHTNYGYAGGINTAMGYLYQAGVQTHDVLICINNDTVLTPDALKTIKAWCGSHATIGLAGPIKGVTNILTGHTSSKAQTYPWEQPYIDGSLFVIEAGMLATVRGMPDDLFMYWEDVELSRRVRQAGYPLTVIPNIVFTHHVVAEPSDDKIYYLVRNGAWYLERQTSTWARWYWVCLNHIRSWVHTYGTRKKVVQEALHDARHLRLGKRHV